MDNDAIQYIQSLGQGIIAPLSAWGEEIIERPVHEQARWYTGLPNIRRVMELHTPNERYVIAHMRQFDKNYHYLCNKDNSPESIITRHVYYIIRPFTIPPHIHTKTGIHSVAQDTLHLAATIQYRHMEHTHTPEDPMHHVVRSLRHKPKAPQDLFDRLRDTYLSMTVAGRAAMYHDIQALFPSLIFYTCPNQIPTEKAPEFAPTIHVDMQDIHAYYSKKHAWNHRNRAINTSQHESLAQRRRMCALLDTLRIQCASLCTHTPQDTP